MTEEDALTEILGRICAPGITTTREMAKGIIAELRSKVTRVEVIDATGRSYVNQNVHDIALSVQDDGRTLKVFIQDTLA